MNNKIKFIISQGIIFLVILFLFIFVFPKNTEANISSPEIEIIREINIDIDKNQIDFESSDVKSELAEIEIYPIRILKKDEDIDLLARLIEAEAGLSSISLGEKICVGLTVLHRIDNPMFPNNLRSNIYIGSQYTVPAEHASDRSKQAAEIAYDLWKSGRSYELLPSEALYFKGDGEHNYFHDSNGNIYEDLAILKLN